MWVSYASSSRPQTKTNILKVLDVIFVLTEKFPMGGLSCPYKKKKIKDCFCVAHFFLSFHRKIKNSFLLQVHSLYTSSKFTFPNYS